MAENIEKSHKMMADMIAKLEELGDETPAVYPESLAQDSDFKAFSTKAYQKLYGHGLCIPEDFVFTNLFVLKVQLWQLEEAKLNFDAYPWILDMEETKREAKTLVDILARELPNFLYCRLVKEKDEAGVTEINKGEWEKAPVMRPKHNTAQATDVYEDDMAKSSTRGTREDICCG